MRRAAMALLLLCLALPGWAQEPAEPQERAQDRIATYLQLSDEQITQWNELLATRESTVTPLREDIEVAGEELRLQLDGEDPDATQVGELTISIHDLREEIAAARELYAGSFADLLDEDQTQRYRMVRGAQRLQPLLPAFRHLGLLPHR